MLFQRQCKMKTCFWGVKVSYQPALCTPIHTCACTHTRVHTHGPTHKYTQTSNAFLDTSV